MPDSKVSGVAAGFERLSRRKVNVVGFLICALALGYAYFAQFVQGVDPCPLCIFQRLAIFGVGLVYLVAAIHNPQDPGAKVYGVLIDLAATIGLLIAIRHVWIQQLSPEEAPRCGPGLEYMLENFPFGEMLKEVLTGSGECANVDWGFLGVSMPTWNIGLFLLLGTMGLVANWWLRR